jgi:hypothetical protein
MGGRLAVGRLDCTGGCRNRIARMVRASRTPCPGRDHAAGFCVFNDVAVAIQFLRKRGLIRRASVIDLDVHQGDGTAEIFQDDPDVFTLSIHCESNFPFRKKRSCLDVALPDGVEDAEYLIQLDEVLPAAYIGLMVPGTGFSCGPITPKTPCKINGIVIQDDPTYTNVGHGFIDQLPIQFDPRLGVAWDPKGNSRTSIRGGFGIFYDFMPSQLYGGAGGDIFQNNFFGDAAGQFLRIIRLVRSLRQFVQHFECHELNSEVVARFEQPFGSTWRR